MDFILVLIGLAIFFIFLFKRETLVDKKALFSIVIVCVILFIIGYILQFLNIKNGQFLKMPLIQYTLYRFCYFIFVKIYKREPKDTWWTMDLSLMKDGIFNFIAGMVSFVLPWIFL